MKKLVFIALLFFTTPAFAQTDWNNDPGAAWNSHTASDYNQQNQMQEEQARQNEQMREQHDDMERQQQEMQQQQDQFNSLSPDERMTYGHI